MALTRSKGRANIDVLSSNRLDERRFTGASTAGNDEKLSLCTVFTLSKLAIADTYVWHSSLLFSQKIIDFVL